MIYFYILRLSPANFHEGMRILTERKASNDEMESYIDKVQQLEVWYFSWFIVMPINKNKEIFNILCVYQSIPSFTNLYFLLPLFLFNSVLLFYPHASIILNMANMCSQFDLYFKDSMWCSLKLNFFIRDIISSLCIQHTCKSTIVNSFQELWLINYLNTIFFI